MSLSRFLCIGLLLLSPSVLNGQTGDEPELLPADVQAELETEENDDFSSVEEAVEDPKVETPKSETVPESEEAAVQAPQTTESLQESDENTESEQVPLSSEAAVSSPASSTQNEVYTRRAPGAFFGFGLGKVTDLGKYNHYSVLYGKEENIILFHAGYYLFTYGVDLGLAGKVGYYHAKGHPLTELGSFTPPVREDLPAGVATDPSQNLELTLIPVQLYIDLAYSPFPVSRRIVFRGWFGMEYLSVEESLSANIPSDVASTGVSTLTSKGWNTGTVMGGMLSISLNGLEAQSDYALRAIGVDRTYISPFFEIVTTTNEKMGNFDRKTYGVLISFEGLR